MTICSLFTISSPDFLYLSYHPLVIFFPGRRVLVCLVLPHSKLLHSFEHAEYNTSCFPHIPRQLLSLAGHNLWCFFVPNLQRCENKMSFRAWADHTITVTTIKENNTHDYSQFHYIQTLTMTVEKYKFLSLEKNIFLSDDCRSHPKSLKMFLVTCQMGRLEKILTFFSVGWQSKPFLQVFVFLH